MDIRDELLGMAVVASGGCSCKLRLGGAPPIDAISSYTNIGRPRNLSQKRMLRMRTGENKALCNLGDWPLTPGPGRFVGRALNIWR